MERKYGEEPQTFVQPKTLMDSLQTKGTIRIPRHFRLRPDQNDNNTGVTDRTYRPCVTRELFTNNPLSRYLPRGDSTQPLVPTDTGSETTRTHHDTYDESPILLLDLLPLPQTLPVPFPYKLDLKLPICPQKVHYFQLHFTLPHPYDQSSLLHSFLCLIERTPT